MATQRAATYCSVPPQDGHHRGDSWRLSRLRNARPSAQKSLLSSALPAVTPITDSPESMRNHEVGGACRLTLNAALPAMESQLEQSRSGETSRTRLEMEPPVWRGSMQKIILLFVAALVLVLFFSPIPLSATEQPEP